MGIIPLALNPLAVFCAAGTIPFDSQAGLVTVPLNKLDDLVNRVPYILKIDVEGHELPVLRCPESSAASASVDFFGGYVETNAPFAKPNPISIPGDCNETKKQSI